MVATNSYIADELAAAVARGALVAPAPADMFNYAPGNMSKFRASVAGVISAPPYPVRPMHMALGDSTTRSEHGGTGSGEYTSQRANSWPTLLASALTAKGIPCRSDSFFGGSNQSVANTQAKFAGLPTIGSGVLLQSGTIYSSLGGQCFTFSDATIVAVPAAAWHTCDVYYIQGSGSGGGNVTVDNGSPISLATSSTSALVT